ncbi:flagellar basal body-associated FliL family protein [Henriciella marina]|uniref:flagellar basal body-associated FliL family protein n=1 Tax=Henriciella marina TaxID=453851 RepID=UPI0003658C7A|nr:flagellar basal body-associated FliL family protein [Henriciella marina]
MKQILPAIIAVLFVVLGAGGGLFMKGAFSGGEASASSSHEESAEASPGKGGHGGSDSDGSLSGTVTYYKFNREFIVPVTRGERVESLVIISLNLEIDEAVSDRLYGMEPKLRDNIMSTLIRLSNDGVALGDLTKPENYETIRSMTLANLREIIPTGLENVLILDMAKQHI